VHVNLHGGRERFYGRNAEEIAHDAHRLATETALVRAMPSSGQSFVVLPSCHYGGRTGESRTHPCCEGTVAAPHPTESSGTPHSYQQRIPACPGLYGQIRSLRI